MSEESDQKFFELRKEGKIYISKVFQFGAQDTEPLRNIRIVFEGNDRMALGEIGGALCLRLTGQIRKTQVTALVTQDEKRIKRISLQTFKARSGDWYEGFEKDEFTFREDEFIRLQEFIAHIPFIDLSNNDNFQIEDISTKFGPKTLIDASDRGLVDRVRGMPEGQRIDFLRAIQNTLTTEEINLLLGRKEGLEEFERQIVDDDWSETDWQDFFERQQWVFGYGLDYRIMGQFDREMKVGAGGTDNRNQPMVDFLMSFTDYTVLVEIKKPSTRIFKEQRGGRAGTWVFSSDFIGAVSQIVEQKAEWLAYSQAWDHFDKVGANKLAARTRNAKSILVIGSKGEFIKSNNRRDSELMSDTFELFRRECRSIDIITYDELLERARFIARSE